MRIAAIYDIHGNLPALEAVLRDVQVSGADRIVVGGDVMPGPMCRQTLERLLDLDLPVDFIHGNGESAVLTVLAGGDIGRLPAPAQEAVRWAARQLDPSHAQVVAGWPPALRLHVPGPGEVLFCHATPRNDTDVFTRVTPEERLLPLFAELGVSLVVCGHTHMQFDRLIGGTRVVNAGSVGMPFGVTGADWLLLGPDVQLRHTAYDLNQAASRIRATDYPQAEAFATHNVLATPAEADMLERYSAIDLRCVASA